MRLDNVVSLRDHSPVGQMALTPLMSMQTSMIASRSHGVADSSEGGMDCLTYECGNGLDIIAKAGVLSGDSGLAKRIASKTRCDVPAKFDEVDSGRAIDGFIPDVLHEEPDNRQ